MEKILRCSECETVLDGMGYCGNCKMFPSMQDTYLEAVNDPSHYGGDSPHETIKCLNAWGLESDALLWNAVKYISRAGKKGAALEDLKKASFYLNRRIAALENAK